MNRRKPYYNDDSDYTTNAPSYYDDLARKNKLIKELALRIWDYDEELKDSLEHIEVTLNDYVSVIDGKIELIDHKIGESYNDEIDILLREWVNDGTLNHIINEEIFNTKADKVFVDNEVERIDTKIDNNYDDVTSKLAQTEQ